jgi:hypothetical protein
MFKLFKILNPLWLIENFFTCYWLGGDSPPAPTQTTVTNTNIPDYAQPYVMNMLNAAQSQIYNRSGTGFNQYVPYSNNPANYVAGFSPLQQQAQSSAANLQLPGQYGMGTNLAAQAGYGSLGAVNQANALTNQALNYGAQGANYGNIANQYGGMGAQQAGQTSQAAQQLANMYGGQGAQAGMMGLGIGNQAMGYGQQAANMAGMGYNAGANYANQATNPAAIQQYMNPYLQSSLAPQLAEMQRQYGITGQQEQAGATQAGAFGGSREALMAAENQRNKNTAMNQAIGQGYNNAFNQAQQAQQFGANLGLQGLQAGYQGTGMGITGANTGLQGLNTAIQGAQTGLQGVGQNINAGNLALAGTGQGITGTQAGMAGAQTGLSGVNAGIGAGQYGLSGLGQAGAQGMNLANIGNNQLAAQQGIIGTQAQQGSAQQNQQQQIINQAIQNYATAQQYPFMQLGMLNSMLRGLPMQQASTSMYQAAPSTVSQLAGLGTAGLGAAAIMKADGGVAKDKVKRYDNGGAIPMRMMSNQQLQQLQESPAESAIGKVIAQGQLGLNNYISSNPEASKVMNQPLQAPSQPQVPPPQPGMPPQLPVQQAKRGGRIGLGSIATGDMTKMSSGGILAFADLGAVPDTSMHRFSHEGSSPDDLAFDEWSDKSFLGDSYENHKALVKNTKKIGQAFVDYAKAPGDYLKSLGIGEKLSELYSAAHPTFDKSGNIIKPSPAAAPAPEAPEPAPLTKDQETQLAIDKYNAWKAKNAPQPSVANGLGFDQMLANNPSKIAQQSGLPVPPQKQIAPPPSAQPAPSGLPVAPVASGMPAGAPAQGGYDPTAPGLPMAANPDGFVHTSFGDIPIKNGVVDFAGMDLRKGSASSAMEPSIADMRKAIDSRTSQMKDEALLRLGLGLMAAPARTGHNWADALTNLGTAGTSTLNWMGGEDKENQADINKINQMRLDAVRADQARDLSFLGTMGQIQAGMANKQATLEAQKQLHDERLAEISARYQDKSEDKKLAIDQENYRYIRGQYDHTKDTHYKELTNAGMDDATAQKAAEAYAWNMYKDDPNFKRLGIPRTDMPPPPPKKKSGWDWNPFDDDNENPAAKTAQPAQKKSGLYSALKSNQ